MTISSRNVHDVLVVGGGVIGLCTALELARRGRRVRLIDRGQIGRQTSWAATGILPPANFQTATDPMDQLRGFSHELFPAVTADLLELTEIDSGFRRCGGWYLAETIGERAAMTGTTEYWRDLSIDCEAVTADELARREPSLAHWAGLQSNHQSTTNVSAWWAEDECQIRSPDFLKALHKACLMHDVVISENTAVTDIRESSVGAEVLADEKWLGANQVVLCGGPWIGFVAESMRLQNSIVPVRGQILMLRTAQPVLRPVVNVGHRYLVCRDDGNTLIGSCEEEVGFELGTTPDTLQALRDFAGRICPTLADAEEIKSWSGLRPLTFDGFPMIGRLPESEHIYIAGGHFRSGLHFSLGTGVIISDLLTGQAPPIDLAPFRVGKQQSHTHQP